MAQSHSLRSRLEAREELLEREDHRAISVENIKTSCHFHHIDIDSTCSIPLTGRSAVRAAEITRGETRPARMAVTETVMYGPVEEPYVKLRKI
jgi:hypothetical protein